MRALLQPFRNRNQRVVARARNQRQHLVERKGRNERRRRQRLRGLNALAEIRWVEAEKQEAVGWGDTKLNNGKNNGFRGEELTSRKNMSCERKQMQENGCTSKPIKIMGRK